MWKHSDDNEGSCKGLRVKYHLGSTAAGSLLPTVIIYSGFNDTEIPNEDFYVCQIPGLAVNAHLDIRNQDMGYVCFMRKGVKQIRFFDWYEKNITIPTVITTRQRYEGINVASGTTVGAESNVVHWSDSDIP